MGNIFYPDFRDFIENLNKHSVEYILIGGYSVVLHGYSRSTGDMDIWVNRSKDNYMKLYLAFVDFGMSVFDMTEENFLNHPSWDVFSFGTPPVCIDILVKVKGLNFDECYTLADLFEDDGLKVRTLNYNHLIRAKKESGRPRDIDDINNLESKH